MSAQAVRDQARRLQRRLLSWLLEEACPLWSTRGMDPVFGGFHEKLYGAEPVRLPRRARLSPRHMAAFTDASRLGWSGEAPRLVGHALDYFLRGYRRPDGLFRSLIAPDGTVLDDRALLYDQAFALLGFAAGASLAGSVDRVQSMQIHPGGRAGLVAEARALYTCIQGRFAREGAGFVSSVPPVLPLSSNAHMHLFEASLACLEIDADGHWQALADALGDLALAHFRDPSTGAIREHFATGWARWPAPDGRRLEPGHQYEWAWLLLRWGAAGRPDARSAALRLIDIGERYGLFQGVVVDALLDDFSIHDACARLWPQTELLKAAARAACLTGETRYWGIAVEAGEVLWRYLQTPVRGAWYDRLIPGGRFIEEPSPASSLYHLVGAIDELTSAIERS